MNENLPTTLHLPRDQFRKIDQLCSLFEHQWHPEKIVDFWAAYMPTDQVSQNAFFMYLWKTDREQRQKAKLYYDNDHYENLFPQFKDHLQRWTENPETNVQLISSAGRNTPVSFKTDRPITPPPHLDVPPTHRAPEIDGYTIQSLISFGGMGEVWRAIQHGSRQVVAIKVIRSNFVDNPVVWGRFQREIELTAQLNHPNVARIYHCHTNGNPLFYVMEFVEGKPLDEYIRKKDFRNGRLSSCLSRSAKRSSSLIHKKSSIAI